MAARHLLCLLWIVSAVFLPHARAAEPSFPAPPAPLTLQNSEEAPPTVEERATADASPLNPGGLRRFQGLIGVVSLLALCVLLSANRRAIRWRIVVWGLALQVVFALGILRTDFGRSGFDHASAGVNRLLGFTHQGAYFLFGNFYVSRPDLYETLTEDVHASDPSWRGPYTITVPRGVDEDGDGVFERTVKSEEPMGTILLFHVLPTIIFFSALMSLLYHLGIIQVVVKVLASLMSRTMGTSGSESLSAAANIFVGQTEAPLVVKPFVSGMTRSELNAIMIGGFATVAGGVLALYMSFVGPEYAGHLIAASVMAAPCGLVVAKLLQPEVEHSQTAGDVRIQVEKKTSNVIDAIAVGTIDGLRLMLNVAAMLLVFIALVAMVNAILDGIFGISLWTMFGFVFRPLAWAMGASWEDARHLGDLLGTKIVLNELIAYSRLSGMTELSSHGKLIATYALCGFANFASIGIQIGGIGGIAPERRQDLARLGMKAMFGGAVTTCITASIAGILY